MLSNPLNALCPVSGAYGAGQAPTLWACFGAAAALNLLLCVAVYAVAPALLALVFGGFYRAVRRDTPARALSLRVECVILYNASVTGTLAAFEALLMHRIVEYADDGRERVFDVPARPAVWLAVGAIIGYMVWHMVVLFLERERMALVLSPSMYRLMWVHHACSVLLWPLGLYKGKACYFIAMFCASELTSVPLAFRTFGLRMGKPFTSSLWFQGANFTWLVIWVLIRMVPIPSMLQSLWRADWAALDAVETVACVFCVVPILMNSWWFYLMLQGMWKQFCGSNDKKSGENAGVKKKK
jgi:hypothetical protein